jgi:tetratricopeptide (TPR) repeat protein
LFSITDIINLYRQWSDFAYESHQVELVEQIGAKLQYLGNQENHPLFLGTAQVILSDACFLRLDFETGLTLIEEGINNLEIAGDQEALIKAIKRKGVISWWTMNYDDVELSARRVLALSPKIELDKDLRTSLEFNAEHLINMMQYTHGQASLAAQTAQRLYNTYFHKLEPFDRLRSLYLIGYSSLIAADYEKCENSVMRALEIARPLGNGLLEEVLLIILAKAEHIQGKVDRAFQHATQALESAESARRKGNIVSANCILGDIYPLLNNDTAALKHYRVGQIREGFSSHSYYGLENNIHFAHYLSYSNQTEEARKILDHALRVTRKYNLGTLYVKALMTSGVWNQKVGNLNIARNHFEEAIKLAKESGLAYELALVKLAYACFLMEKSDIKAAKTHLEEVLIIAQEKNMLWVKLFALMSGIALTRINGQVDKRKEYQASLQKTIDKLKANIEIEPLKDQFAQASEDWIKNFV